MDKMFKDKKTIRLICWYSFVIGMLSFANSQYYSLTMDRMNTYPFRETVMLVIVIACLIILAVSGVLHGLQSIRKKEFQQFVVIVFISLFLGLFIVEIVINWIDIVIRYIFHLFPDESVEALADVLSQIRLWLAGFGF